MATGFGSSKHIKRYESENKRLVNLADAKRLSGRVRFGCHRLEHSSKQNKNRQNTFAILQVLLFASSSKQGLGVNFQTVKLF